MGSKASGIIMACIGGIGTVVGIVLMFSGSSDIYPYFLAFGILSLILGIRIQSDAEKDQQRSSVIEETKDIVDFQEGILYLKKQDPKLRGIVTIEDHYTGKLKYNPETIHYGSVTVGGVTTGGVYKTGGDYTTISKKSEMKHMCYDGHMIVDIELTDELCKKAKASSISKYLEGNRIQIMGREFLSYAPTSVEQVEIGKGSGTTYEKCNDVLNWICGEETVSRKPSSKEPTANEWKCPKCGRINQNYVGTCGCGGLKPR